MHKAVIIGKIDDVILTSPIYRIDVPRLRCVLTYTEQRLFPAGVSEEFAVGKDVWIDFKDGDIEKPILVPRLPDDEGVKHGEEGAEIPDGPGDKPNGPED